MTNTSDIAGARAAVVHAARQLLAGEIGVIDGARAIAPHRHDIDPEMTDAQLLTFVGVDSESDGLAYESVLQAWDPSLRQAKLDELRDFEAFYRAVCLRDAAVLIERYDQPA